MHHGTVTAASAGSGKGATFTVTLPLTLDAAVATAKVAGRTNGGGAPPAGLRIVGAADPKESPDLVEVPLTQHGARAPGSGSPAPGVPAGNWHVSHCLSSGR